MQDAYDAAVLPARETYETAQGMAQAAYDEAVREPHTVYAAAVQSLRESDLTNDERNAQLAAAQEAYGRAIQPARDAYAATVQPARDAYDAAVKTAQETHPDADFRPVDAREAG